MLRRLEGKSIVVKVEHSSNAFEPMLFKDDESVKSVSVVFPLNALLPIDKTPLPKLTFVVEISLANA